MQWLLAEYNKPDIEYQHIVKPRLTGMLKEGDAVVN